MGNKLNGQGQVGFAYELKAGLNLTNKLSIGIVWNAMSNIGSYRLLGDGVRFDIDDPGIHTGALELNIGYRF